MAGRVFTGRLRWEARLVLATEFGNNIARRVTVLQQESRSVNGNDEQWHDVPTVEASPTEQQPKDKP